MQASGIEAIRQWLAASGLPMTTENLNRAQLALLQNEPPSSADTMDRINANIARTMPTQTAPPRQRPMPVPPIPPTEAVTPSEPIAMQVEEPNYRMGTEDYGPPMPNPNANKLERRYVEGIGLIRPGREERKLAQRIQALQANAPEQQALMALEDGYLPNDDPMGSYYARPPQQRRGTMPHRVDVPINTYQRTGNVEDFQPGEVSIGDVATLLSMSPLVGTGVGMGANAIKQLLTQRRMQNVVDAINPSTINAMPQITARQMRTGTPNPNRATPPDVINMPGSYHYGEYVAQPGNSPYKPGTTVPVPPKNNSALASTNVTKPVSRSTEKQPYDTPTIYRDRPSKTRSSRDDLKETVKRRNRNDKK